EDIGFSWTRYGSILPPAQAGEQGGRQGHCILMFASRMTFFHMSYSALSAAGPSSGLGPFGSTPHLAPAGLNSGLDSTLPLIVALSLASTSFGRPAGAKIPSQRSIEKPLRPASSTVGRSGIGRAARESGRRQRAHAVVLGERQRARDAGERE